MAKYTEIEGKCRKIVEDARNGVFAPVYLLMGGEPYYPDMVCDAIMKYALQDDERDFNQAVYYGLDTDADAVASEARSYPMMAERRLVVLKEAQSMKTLEGLGVYAAEPMDTTVLVILMHGASADKRKALYKNVSKKGIVLESEPLSPEVWRLTRTLRRCLPNRRVRNSTGLPWKPRNFRRIFLKERRASRPPTSRRMWASAGNSASSN